MEEEMPAMRLSILVAALVLMSCMSDPYKPTSNEFPERFERMSCEEEHHHPAKHAAQWHR
jgi:hypothetical protein